MAYRIRVGGYRVLCVIYDVELVVEVVKAGHLRDIYRQIKRTAATQIRPCWRVEGLTEEGNFVGMVKRC